MQGSAQGGERRRFGKKYALCGGFGGAGPRCGGARDNCHAKFPAEQADLFRLCILAHQGGLWVDADDALYGDMSKVLGAWGQGLIVCRAPLGGGIGNNFIAAALRQPVVLTALQIAQQALLRRDNETAWSKTGSGGGRRRGLWDLWGAALERA